MSYAKNSEGVLEITDVNNYYPFGLNHIEGQIAKGTLGSYFNYKYNGKELQETGMYDYGARMYMPDLGRWGVVDPLAEQYRRWSPYNYAVNNPIRFIDPDGRGVNDVIITGDYKDKVLAQLQAATNGQLDLKMDEGGKVTATAVKGAKLTDASATFLKATQDNCNIAVLKSDGDYRFDDGTFYVGGAYGGSKMAGNGKMIGINVVNPMVNEKMDEALGIPKGVGTLHEALELYSGLLNSPGSPGATSEENNAKGYNAAHKDAKKLDPRFRDPGSDFTTERTKDRVRNTDGRLLYTEEEVFYINKKTKEQTSLGRFKTLP
ncbi:RHS repeat-associated core domain-containing protein [Chryseobacterium vaccae]|uniref:RHS repeat-associated core domain-containing protein n=1 Tax=Chryseobacterium vaccae TaxID=2604424 RepID=UPI003743E084